MMDGVIVAVGGGVYEGVIVIATGVVVQADNKKAINKNNSLAFINVGIFELNRISNFHNEIKLREISQRCCKINIFILAYTFR